MCPKENCTCSQHRLLNHLEVGKNAEAKLLLKKIKKFWELNDASGSTLLHYAVKYKNAEIIQHLIEKKCKVNAQDISGMTALMLAIQAEAVKAVEILLKNGADIYVANSDGSSLEQAFNYRLRKSPISPLKQDSHIILEMVFDKLNSDFLKDTPGLKESLLKANEVLKLAIVAFADIELTKFILKSCSSIINFHEPKCGRTALHCAVIWAKMENVKILMEHGANCDTLDFGPDIMGPVMPFRIGCSALHYYTGHLEKADNQSEILKSMLRRSEIYTRSGKSGFTDLKHLLMYGKKDTVKMVFLSGINVEACMKQYDRTILSRLIANRDVEVLDIIDELNIKLDVNERRAGETTPLMTAAIHGCPKRVDFLLQRGANVNLTTSHGMTALSMCCSISIYNQKDEAEVIELLLRYGSDAQHPSCVQLLLKEELTCALKIFVAHLAILESREETMLSDLFRNEINSRPKVKKYFGLCLQLLEEMKRFKLNGSVTLFKLLIEKEDAAVVSYVRNRELISAFSTALENFSSVESYYFNTLRRRLTILSNNAKLLEKVIPVMEVLTGLCGDVYRSIIYQILHYLDRQDLHTLCQVKKD